MSSIELFAGAGGLAMGVARAGFQHTAIVEWDHNACQTIRANKSHYDSHGEDFDLYEGDAREFDLSRYKNNIELISGGPPCQPFSMGGKHKGNLDDRDMFPIAVRSINEILPKAFIFENVKGLLRKSFSDYFNYTCLQLSYPNITKKNIETWEAHLSRLVKAKEKGVQPLYKVAFKLLNSADYGVPQKRERVFIVGFRSDLSVDWEFPRATHSEDSLIYKKWVTGEYWKKHNISKAAKYDPPKRFLNRIKSLKERGMRNPNTLPWVTVRDALSGLSDPEHPSLLDPQNHVYTPGAKIYKGHTGSPWDEPSKTLKAGAHGVPGGENMLVRDDGSVRYFTVREAARLQTFPDDYFFHGAWSETMRQLGNAVPVKLAEVVASSVAEALSGKA